MSYVPMLKIFLEYFRFVRLHWTVDFCSVCFMGRVKCVLVVWRYLRFTVNNFFYCQWFKIALSVTVNRHLKIQVNWLKRSKLNSIIISLRNFPKSWNTIRSISQKLKFLALLRLVKVTVRPTETLYLFQYLLCLLYSVLVTPMSLTDRVKTNLIRDLHTSCLIAVSLTYRFYTRMRRRV